jgi:hypothetical protein
MIRTMAPRDMELSAIASLALAELVSVSARGDFMGFMSIVYVGRRDQRRPKVADRRPSQAFRARKLGETGVQGGCANVSTTGRSQK